MEWAKEIFPKFPERPESKIAFKFPNCTSVMTVRGYFWMWKATPKGIKWYCLGQNYIDRP